jgi:hypothetical protein
MSRIISSYTRIDVSVAIHIPSAFLLVVYLTTLSISRLYDRMIDELERILNEAVML